MLTAVLNRLVDLWGRASSSYLVVPALMLVLSVGLALGMVYLDTVLHAEELRVGWLSSIEAGAVRTILATVAGSMATIAGVVFSINIVALQLAASQFGPHVIRNFLTDLGSQIALGTFVGTFTYSLMVLVTSRSDASFVPYASTYMGLLLAIGAMAVLVYYISHVAHLIRLESVVASLARSLFRSIEVLFPDKLGQADGIATPPAAPAFCDWPESRGRLIKAASPGYIRHISETLLMRLASRHDLIVLLEARPGDYVVPGMVLLRADSTKPLN